MLLVDAGVAMPAFSAVLFRGEEHGLQEGKKGRGHASVMRCDAMQSDPIRLWKKWRLIESWGERAGRWIWAQRWWWNWGDRLLCGVQQFFFPFFGRLVILNPNPKLLLLCERVCLCDVGVGGVRCWGGGGGG